MGAGQFDLDIHVGALVLDALITSDGLAEGNAGLGVFDRHCHRRRGRADRFIGENDRGAIEPQLVISRTAQRLGGDAIECQPAMAADKVHCFQSLDLGGGKIDQPQRRPIGTGGGDNRQLRTSQIGHRCLDAVERVRFRRDRQRLRVGSAGFVPGDNGDAAAIRDAGKILRLLRLIARHQQCFGGKQGRYQRHTGERAAGGFGEHARFLGAHAQPAMGFGDARRGPAERGNFSPERGVKSRGILGHRLAGRRRAGLIGKQLLRLVAQRLGIVGKIKIHETHSPILLLATLRERQPGSTSHLLGVTKAGHCPGSRDNDGRHRGGPRPHRRARARCRQSPPAPVARPCRSLPSRGGG